MNSKSGIRPILHEDILKKPNPPPRPKFVSWDTLTSPRDPCRTWADTFEDFFKFFIAVGVSILIIELVLQIILYGYLQAPLPGPKIPGRRTHYDTLGIDHDAGQEAITTAWHLKEKILHPDIVGNTDESREAYYWIQLAYVELSDPLARCYHDQYHGFIPRKFGKDDPCIEILWERARQARQHYDEHGGAQGREGIPIVDAARNKVFEKWGHWRDAMADQKERFDNYGGWVEKLQTFLKRIAAWPFLSLGVLFGILRVLFEYVSELAERYEWRHRIFQHFYL